MIVIDGKEIPLCGANTIAGNPKACKRKFGCGYAVYQYHLEDVEVKRTLAVKPSETIDGGCSAFLTTVEIENHSDRAQNIQYVESITAHFVEIQYQHLAEEKRKIAYHYEENIDEAQNCAMVRISGVAEDPLLCGTPYMRSCYDGFPPTLYVKALSKEVKVLIKNREISTVRECCLLPGDKLIFQIITGYFYEYSQSGVSQAIDELGIKKDENGKFSREWKQILPTLEQENNPVLRREMQWHAYVLEAMATYSHYYRETKIPQGTMDDCIERGKALLDGGVRYLGGTCETYGNINASDSLYAVKKLVFEDKRITLEELCKAVKANFEGYESIRKLCLDCDKYGNDLDTADEMANDLYEYVSKGIRNRGIRKGMQYFLIVISNNSLNTEWGIKTAASPDGRLSGMYMNPANNPQGGADKNGPTAMLNSLTRFDAKYHAGSVQNIKFSIGMFNKNRDIIETLFKTYFKKGGCHLMVTVVDSGALEDAMVHPEKYPNLIVRVAGYSAVFVNLDPTVQQEVLSRTLYDERNSLR